MAMEQLMRVMCVLAGGAALGTAAFAEKISVHVNQIDSGDTIEVKLRRKPVKIHLWGIAAPVKGQAFFSQSKMYLSGLILNKDVIADVKAAQPGGDLVAKITWLKPATGSGAFSQVVDVGLQTVEAGTSWWNPTVASGAKDLQSAQIQAKSVKKGLWALPNPVAPWTYGKPKAKPKK